MRRSVHAFPVWFLTALLFVLWGPLSADPLPVEAIKERIAQEIEAQGLVGLAVAIGHEGEVVYQEGFGWADRENEVAVGAETMFRWASISKPVTAVAAMQLVEQEKLDLNADVRSYVAEFPEKPWAITPHQLLCHQGGVVHYSNGKVIRTRREYDVPHPFADMVLALDTFKESPLVAQPGTKYSYTTHGYILLGAVVQRAGGAPFHDQVKERICEPLGLKTLQPDYQWVEIPNRAVGYRGTKAFKITSTNTDVSWKLPGGGFISTIGDLCRFGIGMVEHQLVKPETREQMWSRQALADGTETGYGLGFGVRQRQGRLIASHSGAQEKARTVLILDPEARLVVAVMTNTEGAKLGKLGYALLDIVAERAPVGAR